MGASIEERREVASEMRHRGYEGYYFEAPIVALELGVDIDDYGEDYDSFSENAWNRLADFIEPVPVTGSTSDGYHTFDELYDHRAKLFSVIVRAFESRAWKSLKHADGTMYDGMFIVGIETPGGQATYHYDVDPYWGIFDCEELDAAPEWDGHTPEQAIERIAALADLIEVVSERTCRVLTEKRTVSQTQEMHIKSCSACGYMFGAENHCQLLPGLDEEFVLDDVQIPSFCPNCGAKVIKEES